MAQAEYLIKALISDMSTPAQIKPHEITAPVRQGTNTDIRQTVTHLKHAVRGSEGSLCSTHGGKGALRGVAYYLPVEIHNTITGMIIGGQPPSAWNVSAPRNVILLKHNKRRPIQGSLV